MHHGDVTRCFTRYTAVGNQDLGFWAIAQSNTNPWSQNETKQKRHFSFRFFISLLFTSFLDNVTYPTFENQLTWKFWRITSLPVYDTEYKHPYCLFNKPSTMQFCSRLRNTNRCTAHRHFIVRYCNIRHYFVWCFVLWKTFRKLFFRIS